MSDAEYVLVDGGAEPITDVKILSKKENKPTDYELVNQACVWGRGVRHAPINLLYWSYVWVVEGVRGIWAIVRGIWWFLMLCQDGGFEGFDHLINPEY